MIDQEYQHVGHHIYGAGGFARLLKVLRALGKIADGDVGSRELAQQTLDEILKDPK
ncbi:MAG: hypothetical protein OK457_00500 [Thaumarchaeota archaeon]|nr:hypothetical protein [Nitrososphaerota archaeon]